MDFMSMFNPAEKQKMFDGIQAAMTKGAYDGCKKALEEMHNSLLVPITDQDARCFLKAKAAGEETFTLSEHDTSAPEILEAWADRNVEHAPLKAKDAIATAERWRKSAVVKRNADDPATWQLVDNHIIKS